MTVYGSPTFILTAIEAFEFSYALVKARLREIVDSTRKDPGFI